MRIDKKLIEERANKAAEKAYLDEVERYYTGYDSPYRLAIRKSLEAQELKIPVKLPEILDSINTVLKAEIDKIANTSVFEIVIKELDRVIGSYGRNATLSSIITDMVAYDTYDGTTTLEIVENSQFEWLDCILSKNGVRYEFTLHSIEDKYKLLSMPHSGRVSDPRGTVLISGHKVEIPYIKNIANDDVLSILFKLFISGTIIDVDCEEVTEDMYIKEDEC